LILNQHHAHAVVVEAVEQCRKAWPALDGISAGDRCIVVLGHNLEARPLGVSLDSFSLAPIAVLVTANVDRRARPQLREGFDLRLVCYD